jgi:hypothetical protein
MARGGWMPRSPAGWFVFALVEFLVVVGLLATFLPETWPLPLQAGIAVGAFAGLVVLNLRLQRRSGGPR